MRALVGVITVLLSASLMGCGGCGQSAQSPKYCGDGRIDQGEVCDCGTDPDALPLGCTAVNGAAGGECSSWCGLLCGNGVLDPGEECDCGTNHLFSPPRCASTINGAAHGLCSIRCQWENSGSCGDGIVQPELGEECEGAANCFNCRLILECRTNVGETGCSATSFTDCCDDAFGASTVCVMLGSDNYCLRECSSNADCYWSNVCELSAGNTCVINACGPGQPEPALHAPCTGPHGLAGYCLPYYGRDLPTDDMFGVCFEFGSRAPTSDCTDFEDSTLTDLSVDVCDKGFCREGECVQFCDWEKVYAAVIYDATPVARFAGGCPGGTACWPTSSLDPVSGVRSADESYCAPQAWGVSCSLVTGQRLDDPAQRCRDLAPEQRCDPVTLADGAVTTGSLVGRCRADAVPNRAVWEICAAGDTCPSGSTCEHDDGVGGAGPRRCVPYCDTAYHDGVIATCRDVPGGTSVDASALCRSISDFVAPTDIHPTRLGLCTL